MMNYRILIQLLIVWLLPLLAFPQDDLSQKPYRDLTHESRVFGHPKSYRLYLPQGYENSAKRYPVVYFFHGWGGRHSMDDNAKLEYAMLKRLVDKYDLIMVMWDGNIDGKEPRPYNVGNHEDVKFSVQMKDYFPELVSYIDQTYRTLTDRNHRGIIGFSMGGFMSLFLSGKYPDQVCAGVSIMGSPEFFVGSPENHTLYPVRYTFKNLQDVDFRIHTSDTDILYNLNEEVKYGAAWEGKPVESETFPGGHRVDNAGETIIFEKALKFVADSFKKVHQAPERWSHYDLYPSFRLWGYSVESNKQQPGFIFLKNVDKTGFGGYTRQWLPDGPPLAIAPLKVTTAPIYAPNKTYQVVTYSATTGKIVFSEKTSNSTGQVAVELDAKGSEVGIFNKTDAPNWVCLDYKINGKSRFLTAGSTNKLALRLFNRGGEKMGAQPVRVVIRSADGAVVLQDSVVQAKPVASEHILSLSPFLIACSKKPPLHSEPSSIKLKVAIYTGNQVFTDEISVPVRYDVPVFSELKVDDGLVIRDKSKGTGNANGVVNPGEKIMLYAGKNRLRLYPEDPWVREEWADEMIPARWPDGFTQQSVIQISPDCPDGHEIECLASYETKTFNPIERKVTWGKVKFTVRRK
ncbi:alpha/beta hydrolase [Larkinella terrae]|uniref:Alpha/beta fold hydrolase n=1 Tax=Larkinella terrae TaxID=2025311 RepID=A0A7K0EF07_9BACT|nr:alpha/beta fold hydrolase [Larkinella terrae]MRS60429.1 alpha/beta fold hydrolase [Larkinella terrae]